MTYDLYECIWLWSCRGLFTMIVQFVHNFIMAGFNHAKILYWNVNKSVSRLYINASKVE
jgi:hypothetical protein